MALTQIHTFVAGDILLASELNAELDQIYTGGLTLISPITATLDLDANKIILDDDQDTSIHADTDDQIDFEAGGKDIFVIDGTVASPITGLKVIAGATGVEATIQTTGEVDTGINFENSESEEVLILTPIDVAVNEIEVSNSIANSNPTIASSGDDTDIGIDFENEQGEPILILEPVASGVNEITISNAASGNNPTIACTNADAGGDDDQGITLQNQDEEAMLVLDSVAATKNWLQVSSAATGNPVLLTVDGEDDRGMNLETKNNESMLELRATAAGVNWVQITNKATGNDATIIAEGEANAGLIIQPKSGGSGKVQLGDAKLQFPDADGAANTVMTTDGSLGLSLAALTYASGPAASSLLPLPRAHLAGLQLTNDTDTAHDISIAAGECRNVASVNDTNMVLASAMVKRIDGDWAAGTGNGGHPDDQIGESVKASTWYHVFLIEDGSGTVDAGFDTSISAANLLTESSYTKYRRLGAVLTDAGNDILQFVQEGNYFWWDVAVAVSEAGVTTEVLKVINIPLGIRTHAICNIRGLNGGPYMYSPEITAVQATTTGAPLASAYGNADSTVIGGTIVALSDTSSQVAISATGAATVELSCLGYIDTRGRDD